MGYIKKLISDVINIFGKLSARPKKAKTDLVYLEAILEILKSSGKKKLQK